MRSLYWARQKVLLKAAEAELSGLLSLEKADAGMHLVGWLPPGKSDRQAAARAVAAGVETVALSSCCLSEPMRQGLLLGYPGIRPPLIWRGVRDLARALASPSDGGSAIS